jgi:hypothetical protein
VRQLAIYGDPSMVTHVLAPAVETLRQPFPDQTFNILNSSLLDIN